MYAPLFLKIAFIVGAFTFIFSDYIAKKGSVMTPVNTNLAALVANHTYEEIVLAGGCFWSTEGEYEHIPGVISAVSGYADVDKKYDAGTGPTYEEVNSSEVAARESVSVIYDPNKISTEKILEIYFRSIDPTDNGGQFFDRGYEYTSAVYFRTKEQEDIANALVGKINTSKKFTKLVTVAILSYNTFYPAEEYHQNYKDNNKIRYSAYREGSGRNSYLKDTWSDSSAKVKEIFGEEKTNIQNTMTNTHTWEHFTNEEKAEKLKTLSALQFNVTQRKGTELAFTNEYYNNKEKGIYVDVVSGEPLFLSSDKYDSGTGWPSFVKPIDSSHITTEVDNGLLASRTEVKSSISGSHLGHVFEDGPEDRGGMRYCMNSASLRFINVADMEKEGYGEFIAKIK